LTLDLASELPADKITANALHPATLMDTAMVDRAGMRARATVADGADAVLQLAASPELSGHTGLYYNQLNAERSSVPQAYDVAARARLKALSEELTGVGQGCVGRLRTPSQSRGRESRLGRRAGVATLLGDRRDRMSRHA
jgi:hypothetical protein